MTMKLKNQKEMKSLKEQPGKTSPNDMTWEKLQKELKKTENMTPEELDDYFVQKYGIPLDTNWE